MTIIAAADGSALGNPGPAGWAWYIDENTWAAGGWKNATNNQAELYAVLHLLLSTAQVKGDLHVLCDSQYTINAITQWMPTWKANGWKKKGKGALKNVELLKELDRALHSRQGKVGFSWVKGHAGNAENEIVDKRARAVATAFKKGTTPECGPGFPGAPVIPEFPLGGSSDAGEGARAAIPDQQGLFDLS